MAVESPMMQGRSYLAFSLPCRPLCVMVPEEGDTQSDMATCQVKAVELYRL